MEEDSPISYLCKTRADAERILAEAKRILHKNGVFYVAELKQLIGAVTYIEDHRKGWVFLEGIKIDVVTNGFVIDFPTPGDVEPVRPTLERRLCEAWPFILGLEGVKFGCTKLHGHDEKEHETIVSFDEPTKAEFKIVWTVG